MVRQWDWSNRPRLIDKSSAQYNLQYFEKKIYCVNNTSRSGWINGNKYICIVPDTHLEREYFFQIVFLIT